MRREKWNKLFGNQFSQNISWVMLSNPGLVVKAKHRFLGEPKSPKEFLKESEIVFDRDYVVQYIAKKIISPLQPESYNELQKILSDAWKFYKENLQ